MKEYRSQSLAVTWFIGLTGLIGVSGVWRSSRERVALWGNGIGQTACLNSISVLVDRYAL